MHVKQALSEFFPPKPSFTETDLPSLTGRTYVITGGAAGIGKELTRILYSANAIIYVAGRSLANIEKATADIVAKPSEGMNAKPSSGKIIPMILDLSDLATIKPAVQKLLLQVTKIDAVFLNAGIMTPPKGWKTTQGYDIQWGTNVVGHFVLQKLLLPLLRDSAKQTGEARIVWTSSDGSNMSPSPDGIYWGDINGDKTGLGPWQLYGQSKAGNIILAAETARRYGADNVVAVSLNPGHLKTELQRHSDSCALGLINALLLYDARYGALTELFAGFSDTVGKENNGGYFIPWGRPGKIAQQVQKGLENGSGARLWDLLDGETAQYV
jgi:retinol dehydrogenase-12